MVDTNSQSVELFVDGRSLGVRQPVNRVSRFPDVLIEGRELVAVARVGQETVTTRRLMPGPLATLRLSADQPVLRALPSAQLNRSGSGPARLLAPAEMTSARARHEQLTGCWYIALPIRVPLQRTGRPVTVRVSAPALPVAKLVVEAAPTALSVPEGIELPAVTPRTVTAPALLVGPQPISGPLHGAFEDSQLATDRFLARQQIRTILATGWPHGVPGSGDLPCANDPEFEALRDLLTDRVLAGDGLILADDINCLVAKFNAQYHARL